MRYYVIAWEYGGHIEGYIWDKPSLDDVYSHLARDYPSVQSAWIGEGEWPRMFEEVSEKFTGRVPFRFVGYYRGRYAPTEYEKKEVE